MKATLVAIQLNRKIEPLPPELYLRLHERIWPLAFETAILLNCRMRLLRSSLDCLWKEVVGVIFVSLKSLTYTIMFVPCPFTTLRRLALYFILACCAGIGMTIRQIITCSGWRCIRACKVGHRDGWEIRGLRRPCYLQCFQRPILITSERAYYFLLQGISQFKERLREG